MASDSLAMALKGVRQAKWRSFLMTLGVVVGISSFVTVMSIGEGLRQGLVSQLSHRAGNVVTVRPGTTESRGLPPLAPVGGLSATDVEVLAKRPEVAAITPLALISDVVATEGAWQRGPVVAVNAGAAQLLGQDVLYGSFFGKEDESRPVAILGRQAAERLFGQAAPLGRTVTVRGQSFQVAGVLSDFPLTSGGLLGLNFNRAVFIPFPVARQLQNASPQIFEILIAPKTGISQDALAAGVAQALQEAHGQAVDFSVQTVAKNAEAAAAWQRKLGLWVLAAASTALFIGAIGIMNVMLAGVAERTREIGVRKAIGATDRQLRGQFLTEAIVLGLLGGVISIGLAWLVNYGLRVFSDLRPVISAPLIVWALMLAVGVSGLAGLVPAYLAGRKQPIDALRYE